MRFAVDEHRRNENESIMQKLKMIRLRADRRL